MKKMFRVSFISFIISIIFSVPVLAGNFIDIDSYYVDKMYDLKFTNGIGGNKFGPSLTIKRSDYFEWLSKALSINKENLNLIFKSSTEDSSITAWSKTDFTFTDYNILVNDSPLTKELMVTLAIKALGLDSVAQKLSSEKPFTDTENYCGYIALAKRVGLVSSTDGYYYPKNQATREQAATFIIKLYDLLSAPTNEFLSYYAVSSAGQMKKINDLDSVGFGWGRFEISDNSLLLNTTNKNNNGYFIPIGFQNPLAISQENGIPSLFAITLKKDESQSSTLINSVLTEPTAITSIVSTVNSVVKDNLKVSFDGVIINFESLDSSHNSTFVAFLQKLKKELAKTNKLLYVTVYPQRNSVDVYNYNAIGKIADKVILNLDGSVKKISSSEVQNGKIMNPLTPIDEVYSALSIITDPAHGVDNTNKIILQFSTIPVQWKSINGTVTSDTGTPVSYELLSDFVNNTSVSVNYSTAYQNPYVVFRDDSDNSINAIWFEDARSIEMKIKLAKLFNINSFGLWRLGAIPTTSIGSVDMDIWSIFFK